MYNPYALDNTDRVNNNRVWLPNGEYIHCTFLSRAVGDLFHHGFMTLHDTNEFLEALEEHYYRGVLPGQRRFFSVYSGEYEYFLVVCKQTLDVLLSSVSFFRDLDLNVREERARAYRHLIANFPRNIGEWVNMLLLTGGTVPRAPLPPDDDDDSESEDDDDMIGSVIIVEDDSDDGYTADMDVVGVVRDVLTFSGGDLSDLETHESQ